MCGTSASIARWCNSDGKPLQTKGSAERKRKKWCRNGAEMVPNFVCDRTTGPNRLGLRKCQTTHLRDDKWRRRWQIIFKVRKGSERFGTRRKGAESKSRNCESRKQKSSLPDESGVPLRAIFCFYEGLSRFA